LETVTARVLAELAPQELFAVMDTLPLLAPTVAVIEVEVELPVHPTGSDHVYDVAPLTGSMLYVSEPVWQTAASPVIEPG
jgi:hypothetical protein